MAKSQLEGVFHPPRVCVRVVTRSEPSEPCREGLWMIKSFRPDWDVGFCVNKYSVEMSRSLAVASARKTAAQFLIMLDDDVEPMESIINMPAHDVGVVAGLVPTWREGHFFWNAFHLKTDESILYSITARGPEGGLERVYGAGTAIMCIRRDVFMRKDLDPLFEMDKKPDGTLAHVLGGEDLTFCRKVQKVGIPVYVDHACQGEHYTKIRLLTTLIQGYKHASRDPNHCWPSVFAFDIGKLQIDLAADEYHAFRREQADAQSEKDREAVPDSPTVPQ